MRKRSPSRALLRSLATVVLVGSSPVSSGRAATPTVTLTPRPIASAAGVVGSTWAVSTRTGARLRSFTSGQVDDEFGASVGTDAITRANQRDAVVGAPGANPDPAGGSPHGAVIVFAPESGNQLGRIEGNTLPGGPVRRLGHAATVLGHPTGADLAWWAYGAPGAPGSDDVGYVVVTGDAALAEQYRVGGRRGALFGWAILNTFEDIDGDSARALDYIVSAPLESRGRRRREIGAIYAHSTLTSGQIYRVGGPHPYARFGYATTIADDHDGDGMRDFWVSAPGSPARDIPGVVFLLASANGAELLRIEAPAGAQQFGFALSIQRDFDGDGLADLMVSAPGTPRSRRKPDAGLVVLYSGRDGRELRRWRGTQRDERLGTALGGASTLEGTERRFVVAADAQGQGRLDFYRLDGPRTLRVVGEPGNRLGQRFGGLPDLDADGYPEFMVALPGVGVAFVPE